MVEAKLSINGSHFYMDEERVFLSGANQAWVNYGRDFGNNQYSKLRRNFSAVLDELADAGGNSIRKFVARVTQVVIMNVIGFFNQHLCLTLILVEFPFSLLTLTYCVFPCTFQFSCQYGMFNHACANVPVYGNTFLK